MSLPPVSRKRAREETSVEAEGPFKQAKTDKAEHVAARAISAIEAMPQDLMDKIFTYLGPSARFLARSVCKAFNQAVVDYPPTTFTINAGLFGASVDAILSELRQFPIRELTIFEGVGVPDRYPGALTNAGLAFLKEFHSLEGLELNNCFAITDVGFALHLGALNKLKRLEVYNSPQISDMGFSHLPRLSSLKQLELIFCELNDKGLAHFSSSVNLQELNLSHCDSITDEGLRGLKDLKLTSLNLNNNQVSDRGLVHLEGLSELNHLELSDTEVTGRGFASLAKLLNLAKLVMATTLRLDPHAFSQLKELPLLQSIDLSQSDIYDETVDDLLTLRSSISLDLSKACITEHHYNRLKEKFHLPSWSENGCRILPEPEIPMEAAFDDD